MNRMFNCSLSFVAFLSLVGCQNNIGERMRLDLSGVWQTELGDVKLPGTTDESCIGDTLSVFTEDGRLSRRYTCVRPLTYKKEIELPASFEGKHLRLIMEKTKPSTLFIDGDSIGSFGHLHTPHEYDITGLTKGKHTVEIRIDNSDASIMPVLVGSHAVSEHTQTNWNGVLGDFYIEASEHTYVKRVNVYPDGANKKAKVVVDVMAEEADNVTLHLSAKIWNTTEKYNDLAESEKSFAVEKGINTLEIEYSLGDKIAYWDEFNCQLYDMQVVLTTAKGSDKQSVTFGVRDFKTDGTSFCINGNKTFLRGKHDACVFPLTGYAPMDKESWIKVFRIAKEYGINHYRFHSWTPPRAAFEAADIVGMYLQPEMPYWGSITKENDSLNTFLRNEGLLILDEFGNHASFVMMAHGNELRGSDSIMMAWTKEFREKDPRHLYAYGSNNNLGWAGQKEGEDYFTTCRVGGEMPNQFNTHSRASFSFADAYDGGIINGTYPNTKMTFANAIKASTVPVISHENCQYQVYPDYDEIAKYTGVLRPVNFEIFRERLATTFGKEGVDSLAKVFHQANGALAMACFKADVEMCLRTPGFGGFQLLDLQDYPGQGTALCGVLDAFMETKGLVTAKEFRGYCSALVPMAEMERYTWREGETFKADVVVSNYTPSDVILTTHKWNIKSGDTIIGEGVFDINCPQGEVSRLGTIELSLQGIKVPQKLTLYLNINGIENTYPLWVYPSAYTEEQINYATKLDDALYKRLVNGESVLFVPQHSDIEKQSVGALFTPDYWNYAMFKTISENNGKPVSPGTMGYLINDVKLPLFDNFPTDNHSDWQWWIIAKNSRPMILDGTPNSFKPIVQTIDNISRNHKLGILFEVAVGKGRLLISTTNLKAIEHTPEGRQYIAALGAYLKSEAFAPNVEIEWSDLKKLFTADIAEREIIGVKNISDYKRQNE